MLVETYNADITAADQLGHTALHLAIRGGHLACVDYLLRKGLRCMDVDKGGNRVIHYACFNGSFDVFQKIWDLDPHGLQNYDTWSPLHWACQTITPKLIEFLLEQGLYETSVRTEQPLALWTPVSIGLFHQNPQIESIKQIILVHASKTATVSTTVAADNSAAEFAMCTMGLPYKKFLCDACRHVSLVIHRSHIHS
jgi:Ankyrin repeats (3 copies)